MPWFHIIISLCVGILLGMLISRLTHPSYKKQNNTQKELLAAKHALEQKNKELHTHFTQSAEMLDALGKDYTKLYQHMTKISTQLMPDLTPQENPFERRLAEYSDKTISSIIEEAPKDYALGATGLLTTPPKEIIEVPEMIATNVNNVPTEEKSK